MSVKLDHVIDFLEKEKEYIKKRVPFDFRGHFAVRGELSSVREPYGMVRRLKTLNQRGEFFIGKKKFKLKQGNSVNMMNPLNDKEPIECEIKILEDKHFATCYPEPNKTYIKVCLPREFSGEFTVEYKIA